MIISDINIFFTKAEELIANFMGIDFKFEVDPDQKTFSIEAQFGTKTREANLTILKSVLKPLMQYLESCEDDDVTARWYCNFIDELCMNILFPNYIELSEEEKEEHISFIQQISDLSVKTYETENVHIGMIFIPEESEIENSLEKFSFEYIPFETPIRPIELINSEKPLLKLLDNKSLALVINNNFLATGFVRKKMGEKSIGQLIEEKYLEQSSSQVSSLVMQNLSQITQESIKANNFLIQEGANTVKLALENLISSLEEESKTLLKENPSSLRYLQIGDGSVNLYWNENFVLNLRNGKWSLKHFGLLMLTIAEFVSATIPLLKQGNPDKIISFIKEDLDNAGRLTSIIKGLSQKNKGALFIILPLDQESDEIPKGLLSESQKSNEMYKSVLKLKSGTMNIKSCDLYLAESIASVDGAVILNSFFDILSFGEIVNNKSSKKNSSTRSYGARTTAALSASKYGLAIKISEDGDVDIFNKGKRLLRI